VNAARIVRTILDAVVGVTTAGGGAALAAGLEGGRYPAEWLKGTPFSDYLIPGLILAVVVGGAARPRLSRSCSPPGVGAWVSVLAGVILVGQIGGEIRLLKQRITGIEVAYVAAGLAMMAIGLTLGGATVGRASSLSRRSWIAGPRWLPAWGWRLGPVTGR
jgi:hypothetical protein